MGQKVAALTGYEYVKEEPVKQEEKETVSQTN